MSAPLLIGLTGGMAAGKSSVLDAFARHGAATLSTDSVVHELLGNAQVRERLLERWGEEVDAGGDLDRERIAAIVFDRPKELAWLESVLHPLVGRRMLEWREELPADARLAVVEVPLLFESGMEGFFDLTVCVVADDRLRAGRAGARGTGELEGRSARQLDQAEKAARADHVIRNEGSLEDLDSAVGALVDRLAAEGAADARG